MGSMRVRRIIRRNQNDDIGFKHMRVRMAAKQASLVASWRHLVARARAASFNRAAYYNIWRDAHINARMKQSKTFKRRAARITSDLGL